MTGEKISIIVPVYNVEKYLRDCVVSLMNQSYTDIEILLIDDGSTDKSGAICDEYATKDSRIVVIHKENGGLSDARNVGLDRATGDLIAFVDSDDFVAPNFLEHLYNAMLSEGMDVVECSHSIVVEDDNRPTATCGENKESRILSCEQWMTETNLGKFLSVVVWNKLYKRYLWEDVRFPVGRVYEDDSTTYKLIYKAQKIFRTYDKLYYYRQRKISITQSTLSDKKKQDNIVALTEQIAFFEEKREFELANFAKSKKCLLLISYYFRVSDKTEKREFRAQVKSIFKEIKSSKTIPVKYKQYIRLFLRCPFMAKMVYQRDKG